MDKVTEECKSRFIFHFGNIDRIIGSYAPGRINLIGEHTDYNNGFVFPMALNGIGTVIVGSENSSNSISMITGALVEPSMFVFDADKSNIEDTPLWARYIVGVVKSFEEITSVKVSVNMSILSNLPMGAGLSSSASLEVAVFSFLEKVYNVDNVSKIAKIKACQKAEHIYAGVPCGIMDQFIATLGEKDKALFINCETDEYEVVPFGDDGLQLVVTDTHQKHELAGGEYAKRRATCEAVSKSIGVSSLAKVSLEQLVHHFSVPGSNIDLPEKAYARSRHVVTEIARAKAGRESLCVGNFVKFGKLMNKSHKSLSDDYQVSCKELNEVVKVSWETPGVLGSRLTGGGFGGCVITLVKTSALQHLLDRINTMCPYSTSFSTTAGSGACAWEIFY